MIKSYSKSKNGKEPVSANFKVSEFACNDGSDIIYIDTELVDILQKIRNWAGKPVTITSAYRTPQYNAKVGGAGESYHTKGQAADIVVSGKTPAQTAAFAESIGAGGIGMYDGTAGAFVHIDTRPTRYLWVNKSGANLTVSTHGGLSVGAKKAGDGCPYPVPARNLSALCRGDDVKWLQWQLGRKGYSLSADGIFGPRTLAAVKAYQQSQKLVTDGIAGDKTRGKLQE